MIRLNNNSVQIVIGTEVKNVREEFEMQLEEHEKAGGGLMKKLLIRADEYWIQRGSYCRNPVCSGVRPCKERRADGQHAVY